MTPGEWLNALADYSPIGAGIAASGYFLGRSIVSVFKMILDRTEKEREKLYDRQNEMQARHEADVAALGATCHAQQEINAAAVTRVAQAVERGSESSQRIAEEVGKSTIETAKVLTKLDTLIENQRRA